MKRTLNKPITAFTLIELLVVISIIAILAGIALPAFTGVIERGNQTKVLSNAKQIYLGLKMFAGDYDGAFPSKEPTGGDLNAGATDATDSNAVFKNLVPAYVPTEKIFWVSKSKFCTVNPPTDAEATLMDAGANHFAYVRGCNDTSNPSWPLLADGFKDATAGTYSNLDTEEGGLWKGKAAIVIRVDGSGKVERLNSTDYTVRDYAGGTTKTNIFVESNTSGNNWLADTEVINPLPPAGTP